MIHLAGQTVVNGVVVDLPVPPGTRAEYHDLKHRFPDSSEIVMVYEESQKRYYSFENGALALKDFRDAQFYYNKNGEHGVWFDRHVWPSASGYLIHKGLKPIFSDKL